MWWHSAAIVLHSPRGVSDIWLECVPDAMSGFAKPWCSTLAACASGDAAALGLQATSPPGRAQHASLQALQGPQQRGGA